MADDSHKISYLFFRKLGKMSQNLSSAAVVIGALRVNHLMVFFCWLTIDMKCQALFGFLRQGHNLKNVVCCTFLGPFKG